MYKINKCSGCGQDIIFIKMEGGKLNPCDPELLIYQDTQEKDPMVVTNTGKVQRLSIAKEGRISHFSTCPNAKQFRRK